MRPALALMRPKLDQVTAKVRDAWPEQEKVDPAWPVWLGVLAAHTRFAPLPEPKRNVITPAPARVAGFVGRDGFVPGYGADDATAQATPARLK